MTEVGKSVPKRLRNEPLLEAVWEIRFSSDTESVSDLLPGLIYKSIGTEYPKIERLPIANLPSTVVQQDPKLRYVPTIRLQGIPYSIQIGEHVVSLSCRRPYTGWQEFEQKIMELAKMLRETSLITRPERFSLKYIDIISFGDRPSLRLLEILIKLDTIELTTDLVQLRTELRENGFLHIVQIVSPAQAAIATGEHFEGVLLDIDTIFKSESADFWSDFQEQLNSAHRINKNMFFRLLKKETIENLGPEY